VITSRSTTGAEHAHLDRARNPARTEQLRQVVGAGHSMLVEGHDDVADLKSAACRRTARLHVADAHRVRTRANPGPPELQGFNAAPVWIMPSISRPPLERIERPSA
jgi:hypothetical protein